MTTVLFENHHLYYLPNFIPIINEMRRRGTYKISVSIPAYMPDLEKSNFYDECKFLEIDAINAEDEKARTELIRKKNFDVIIVGNVGQLNKIVTNETLAVMVYHGIGLKQSYYTDIDPRIDLRAVESKSRLAELKSHGHNNLVLTGFTKCDPLAFPQNKIDLNQLGLNTSHKTILYAPSFYPSSLEGCLSSLEKISYETNIIVKLHDFSWYENRYLYQSKAIQKLANEYDNIYLVPQKDYNIIPFYQVADLLISDISSTMFEYLYLNKPIIMATSFKLRLKHRIFYKRFIKKMDYSRMEGVDFAFQMNNPDDLSSLVYHGLEYPSDLSGSRKAAQLEYLYRTDGKASFRLIDAIESKMKNKP